MCALILLPAVERLVEQTDRIARRKGPTMGNGERPPAGAVAYQAVFVGGDWPVSGTVHVRAPDPDRAPMREPRTEEPPTES